MPIARRAAWLSLLGVVAISLAIVLVPVVLIRPFAPQSPRSLSLAFELRRWSPWLTLVAAVVAGYLVARLWQAAPRAGSRAAALFALLPVLASAWLARQNYFEWMFAPLPDARFVRAASAGFVAPNDMVLAVTGSGDAVAYPVRQLAYHHLVQDVVGKVPIVATY